MLTLVSYFHSNVLTGLFKHNEIKCNILLLLYIPCTGYHALPLVIPLIKLSSFRHLICDLSLR
ncbi:hypothetical protein DERF_006187 [Dermatophagoides farinae]|uniref:Uncharacterized protein n=1 Tax=Dermatophagoides farinae TaxID=6954 RepID=A0A922I8E9_DERFA|nr:hypothetical protein DERF_006187 [Dermatophagoides farinae]